MKPASESGRRAGLGALTLGALGVVFGDIGTSPLYTIKTAVEWSGGHVSAETAYGMLSLIVWTLIVITSIKYVAVIMRADNDGEGGILALMSLLGKNGRHPFVIGLGMLGAALLFGDGAITPAISVLSALEGLKGPAPAIEPFIVPLSTAVLIGLFCLQPQGTERISRLFGPIMALWFLAIGALGAHGLAMHPHTLMALDPRVGLSYLFAHGLDGFLVLGAVFLCATGAEALYADMGHFGRRPIRLAWYGFVLPALALSYAGQTALLVEGGAVTGNPFFDLCPKALQLPLVGLATLATIIASQAIVTGAFSMARQAMQLGLSPRLAITQTSAQSFGQIYVGFVNWTLMALTLVLTVAFRSSESLAAAFGIAVSLTMLLTTALMYLAMREVWRWSLPFAALVGGAFLVVDGSFVAANLVKFLEGGWIPLVVASILFFLMSCWRLGFGAMRNALERDTFPIADFLQRLQGKLLRVEGTAVYLTGRVDVVPVALLHNLKHNKVLHKRIVLLHVATEHVPRVSTAGRVETTRLDDDLYAITLHYGFMEQPDIPRALMLESISCPLQFNMMDTSFFVGRLVVTPIGRSRWRRLRLRIFEVMHRNALAATEFFRIPPGRVVELGGQVEV